MPEQGRLPGMEPAHNPKLEKLAKEFRVARDTWQACKPDMDHAREKLEIAMKAEEIGYYETKDGYVAEMAIGEAKAKVYKKPAE